MLTVTVHDEHGYSATAQQRTELTWDIRYYRDGGLESDGWIITPSPYMPPMAIIMDTLETMRREDDYWRASGRGSRAPGRSSWLRDVR